MPFNEMFLTMSLLRVDSFILFNDESTCERFGNRKQCFFFGYLKS